MHVVFLDILEVNTARSGNSMFHFQFAVRGIKDYTLGVYRLIIP